MFRDNSHSAVENPLEKGSVKIFLAGSRFRKFWPCEKYFTTNFFSHFLSIRKLWERKHYLKSRYVGMVIPSYYTHMVYSNIVIL